MLEFSIRSATAADRCHMAWSSSSACSRSFAMTVLSKSTRLAPNWIVMHGRILVHDCHSIGYFLEPLIVLGLFAKKPLLLGLKVETDLSNSPEAVVTVVYLARVRWSDI